MTIYRDDDLITLPGGRRLDRRQFLALGLGAATLATCNPTTPQPLGQVQPTKRLADAVTLAAQVIADTLDPHGLLSNSNYLATRQVFDALVTFDDKGEKIVPQLATEWKRLDSLTMEFKLRDDVKFSNGE